MTINLPDSFNIIWFYIAITLSIGGTYLFTKYEMEKLYTSKRPPNRLVAFLLFLLVGSINSIIAANLFIGMFDMDAARSGFGFKALPAYMIAAFIGWGKSTNKMKPDIKTNTE